MRIALSTAFMAAIFLGPTTLLAQTSNDPFDKLRSGLHDDVAKMRRHQEVALFESVDGQIKFVFDHSGDPPLLRFVDDEEIFVLYPHAASRGDTLYKLDNGEIILRRTLLGGMTVFTSDSKVGDPVILKRAADQLALKPPPRDAEIMLVELMESARRDFGAEIRFAVAANGAQSMNDEARKVMADAGRIAAKAVAQDARDNGRFDAAIDFVMLSESSAPSAALEGGVLHIRINAAMNVEGRPSSLAIAETLHLGGAAD